MTVDPTQLYECFRGIGIFYLIVVCLFCLTMFFHMWKDMERITSKLGEKATSWLIKEKEK